MKIMKLVIGNSNNPYMAENCTLKPVLNQQRVLEYYSGILFLTTNRPGAIDERFKSRIHVILDYPLLNWETTKAIWKMNFRRVKDRVNAEEKQLLHFAKDHYYNDPNIT